MDLAGGCRLVCGMGTALGAQTEAPVGGHGQGTRSVRVGPKPLPRAVRISVRPWTRKAVAPGAALSEPVGVARGLHRARPDELGCCNCDMR